MTGPYTRRLVIFGNAEIASLARYYFENDSDYEVVAFTVDDSFVQSDLHEGLPLVPFSQVQDRFPPGEVEMHVALSYRQLNRLREAKYHQAKAAGYTLASYICSKSVTWPDLKMGDNCFILENQTIQPTVTIGNNVMLWSGNHIGHGTVIEDHVYCASHVVLSGHTRLGSRSFMGVNSTVRDFVTIGCDCVVGMDASVTRDLRDGSTVISPRSEVYPADDRRARTIRRAYFGLSE